jgi:broad specificity phosphatase PhoE
MFLNIYWVRHGYSCANYVRDNESGFFNPFAHTRVPDPRLHDVGKEQAQQLAEFLNRKQISFDLICSSQLSRAIETSETLYNRLDNVSDDKILILPNICEKGNTLDNIPYRYILDIKPKYTEELIGLDYTDYKPDYKFFMNNILIKIKEYLEEKRKEKELNNYEYNIIIVSHSSFLKSIFGIKLSNCQYILEKDVFQNRENINKKIKKGYSFEDAKEFVLKTYKNNYNYIGLIYDTFAKKQDKGICIEKYDKDLNKLQRYLHGFKSSNPKKSKPKKSKPKKSNPKKSKPKK